MRILPIIYLIIAMILLHETAHYEIFRIYGCEDIGFGATWWQFNTHAVCYKDTSLPQSINEIVGYTILPFLLIIIYLISERDD